MGLGYKVWTEIMEKNAAEEDKIKAELEAAGVRPTWKIESSHGFVEHNPKLPELRLMLQVSRLRSALEKYSDDTNWTVIDDGYGDYGLVWTDNDKEPWKLAQEALKDAKETNS